MTSVTVTFEPDSEVQEPRIFTNVLETVVDGDEFVVAYMVDDDEYNATLSRDHYEITEVSVHWH